MIFWAIKWREIFGFLENLQNIVEPLVVKSSSKNDVAFLNVKPSKYRRAIGGQILVKVAALDQIYLKLILSFAKFLKKKIWTFTNCRFFDSLIHQPFI